MAGCPEGETEPKVREKVAHLKGWFTKKKKKMGKLFLRVNGRMRFKYLLAR